MSLDYGVKMLEVSYEDYVPSVSYDTEDDVYNAIFDCLDTSWGKRNKVDLLKRKNEKRKRWTDALGGMRIFTPLYSVEVYDKEAEYINKMSSVIDIYLDEITVMLDVIDEDNFGEISKLLQFVSDHYRRCYSRSEADRKAYLSSVENGEVPPKTDGYQMPCESMDKVNDFFNQEVERITMIYPPKVYGKSNKRSGNMGV